MPSKTTFLNSVGAFVTQWFVGASASPPTSKTSGVAKVPQPIWPRNMPLLQIGEKSVITLEDCMPGALVLSAAGGGKSRGPHDALVTAALRIGAGMAIFCVKGDGVDDYKRLVKREGREHDLVVIDEESGHVFDWMQYEIELAGGRLAVENFNKQLKAVTEVIQGTKGSGGGDPFWPNAAGNITKKSASLVHIAYGEVNADSLLRFMRSVPILEIQLSAKRTEFFRETIRLAIERCPVNRRPELDDAVDYFKGEWIGLGDRTASSVQLTATTPLNALKSDLLTLLLCPTSPKWEGRSSWTPKDLFEGKILLFATPNLNPVYGELGRVLQVICKSVIVRTISARDMSTGNYDEEVPVFIVADECQRIYDESTEQSALETIRSFKACYLACTQNIPNLVSVARDQRSMVDSFLGNFSLRFYGQNLCPITNKFASESLGSHLVNRGGVGRQFGGGAPGGDPNQPSSVNVSEQYVWEPWLQESKFINLRTGNKHSKGYIDSYVINRGQGFQENGNKPYLLATFDRLLLSGQPRGVWDELFSAGRSVVRVIARKEFK